MVRLFACLSLLFFLVPVTYVRGPEPARNTSQYIQLEPIVFDSSDPNRKTVGRLEFLAGWKLTSENYDFGGVSAMLAMPGNRFFMLSDAGVLIGFTLNEIANKAERPFIAPLPEGPPKENEYAKKNWDAEALIHDAETGQFWVGYERYHSIWRYSPSFARKEALRKIPAMQKWPANGGAEAMIRISGREGPDRFLIFSETAEYSKGGTQVLIVAGDPVDETTKTELFGYQAPKGYRITDAVLLSKDKALLLNRRFTPFDGVSAILTIGDLKKIEKGKIWRSKKIAGLKPPIRIDNMEALAVTSEGDDTIIWIASDDNFNDFQETLLMKFRLLNGKKKRKKPDQGDKKEKAEANPGFSALQQKGD